MDFSLAAAANSEGKSRASEDGLFLERLGALFDKTLADIRTFAEREGRSFGEVRRYVAELHSAYLFKSAPVKDVRESVQERVNVVLRHTSQTLETLQEVAGLQSFFLVVNPRDATDEGFLGGTTMGREFWRGHRGCGAAGARAFQAQCMRSAHGSMRNPAVGTSTDAPAVINIASQKKGPASSLKAEVYASIRNAIRAASGIRNAEMKWKDHSKLDIYGIRLEGWPHDVPKDNPSTLSVVQNKEVLKALQSGRMSFVRIAGSSGQTTPSSGSQQSPEISDDFSWACGYPDEATHSPQDHAMPSTNSGYSSMPMPSATAWGEAHGNIGCHNDPEPLPDSRGSSSPNKRRRTNDDAG